MGAPTNLSDQGAGEMSAAAQMHGEPIMRLNQLTRWYVMTSIVMICSYLVGRILDPLMGFPSWRVVFPLSYGSLLMFFSGIGIKFLPSSLGGNPHVYSLRLALWSYWLILVSVLVWSTVNVMQATVDWINPDNLIVYNTLGTTGPLLMLLGSIALAINLWKTMQSRV